KKTEEVGTRLRGVTQLDLISNLQEIASYPLPDHHISPTQKNGRSALPFVDVLRDWDACPQFWHSQLHLFTQAIPHCQQEYDLLHAAGVVAGLFQSLTHFVKVGPCLVTFILWKTVLPTPVVV